MPIDEVYDSLITDLKAGKEIGKRIYSQLEEEEILLLFNDSKNIKKILFLLNHSGRPIFRVSTNLLEMKNIEGQEIFYLWSLLKHVIEGHRVQGTPYPTDLYKKLYNFLNTKNKETLLWTLKVIDELGAKAGHFVEEIKKVCPGRICFGINKEIRSLCLHLIQSRMNLPKIVCP